MSILKRENVISIIYETVKNSQNRKNLSEQPEEPENLDVPVRKLPKDNRPKENIKNLSTRIAPYKIIDPKTGEHAEKRRDWGHERAEMSYDVPTTNLIKAIQARLFPNSIDDYEARQYMKKLRVKVQNGDMTPEDALTSVGIIPKSKGGSYRGDYQLLINTLTANKLPSQSYAIWFQEGGQREYPDAIVVNKTGVYGDEEILVPITCDVDIFKEENYDALMDLSRKVGANPVFIECFSDYAKTQRIKPVSVPQASSVTVAGSFGYPSLKKRILQKYPGATDEEIADYVKKMQEDVKQGLDPADVMRSYGFLDEFTSLDKTTTAILRGEGLESVYKLTGETNLDRKIKQRFLGILRLMFGKVAHTAFDDTNITFGKTEIKHGLSTGVERKIETPAEDYYFLMKDKLIPPIIIADKYIDRYNFDTDNDRILLRGHSYNYYMSIYEFLQNCIGNEEIRKTLNTYHLARQYNPKTRRWESTRALVQNQTGKSKTPMYNLSYLGLEEPNFNVVVRNDWEISGERVSRTSFRWKFIMKISLGKKLPDDKEMKTRLLSLSELNNYFNQTVEEDVTINETGEFSDEVERKLTHRKTKTEKSGQTIMDDRGVTQGLIRVIEYVMDEIKDKFNPEEAFANFANVEQEDLVVAFTNAFKGAEDENQQLQESKIEKLLIERIMKKIKKSL